MNYNEKVFFVTNDDKHTILKITSSGMLIHHSSFILIVLTHYLGTTSVFAGSGQKGSEDGVGREASFSYPRELAIDQETGTLFVSGTDRKIRKITCEGEFALFWVNTC